MLTLDTTRGDRPLNRGPVPDTRSPRPRTERHDGRRSPLPASAGPVRRRGVRRCAPRVVALAVAGLSLLAAAGAGAQDAAAFEARIAGTERAAADLASLSFDRAAVSTGALADSLGTAEAAFRWVRDNTTFDPYEGAMRGARGTLLSRGGNSLDRALLLGEVLGAMGYQWSIAVGELDDAQARALVGTIASGRTLSGAAMPSEAVPYAIESDGRLRGLVARHYWVRASRGGDAQDYDPSFPGLEPGEAIVEASAEFGPDGLPAEVTRRVTIGVYFETNGTDGGVAVSQQAALLDVGYRNLGLSFERTTTGVVPILEVQGETTRGSTIPTTGLRRVWLQLVFSVGAVEDRISRDLYVSGSVMDALVGDDSVFSIVLLPGFVGTDYYHAVLSVLLGGFGNQAADLRRAVATDLGVDASVDALGPSVAAVSRSNTSLALGVLALSFAHASDRLALRTAASLGVRPFYAGTRVLVSGAYRRGGVMEYQLDVRQNRLSAVPSDGVAAAVVPAFEALRGRVDAELSAAVLELLTGRPATSVGELVSTATAAGATLVTVHPGTVRRVDSLGLSAEAVARLGRVVSEVGHFAVGPNRAPEIGGRSILGWWQIAPGTGVVVGATEYGGMDATTLWEVAFASEPGLTLSAQLTSSTLSLLEAVTTGTAAIAGEPDYGSSLVCESACDLSALRRSVCSDERERTPPRVAACLRGDTIRDSSSLIPIGTSCSSQLNSFYCAAATLSAFAGGSLVVRDGVDPAPPTPFVALSSYDWSGCACQE